VSHLKAALGDTKYIVLYIEYCLIQMTHSFPKHFEKSEISCLRCQRGRKI